MVRAEDPRRKHKRAVYRGKELFRFSAREERQFVEMNFCTGMRRDMEREDSTHGSAKNRGIKSKSTKNKSTEKNKTTEYFQHQSPQEQSTTLHQESSRRIKQHRIKSSQRTPLEEQILNEIPVHWDIFSSS